MTRLAVICARKGSQGVPGKNIRLLGGKPLIAWTVDQAFQTGLFDSVVVSSDSSDILAAASEAGPILPVLRPPELATDTASVHPAVIHAIDQAESRMGIPFISFALLQTTSPLRSVADITQAVEIWDAYRPGSVVSVTTARVSPYYTLLEQAADGSLRLSKETANSFGRRQDLPVCWEINGAVYVFDRKRYAEDPRVLFPDTRICEMPPDRSVDIDTEWDWKVVEAVWNK
ncbi:MAG: acylneuraminate cytidylyltransferase family protein [Wenzhouxiangella sp.]